MENKTATDSQTIWQEFQTQGLDYQNKMGFSTSWPEFTRFVEGKQWPAVTEKTKYMPRPVINQLDFIVENRRSNILSQSIKMLFSPDEMLPDVDNSAAIEAGLVFSDAATNTWSDLDQDAINEDVVDDALVLGTGIWHYYWDNSYQGGNNMPYVGRICAEAIDPIDIALGNPHLLAPQLQQQPWIIIRTYPNIQDVKALAMANGKNPDDILPDSGNSGDAKYDSQQINLNKPNTVTLLTKYYKANGANGANGGNGQIMWTKSTKDVVVSDPRPLSPDGSKPFNLYPLEMLTFKKRRRCSFGRSVVEDIIPNQKALNFGLGMMLLSVQQTAWPKIITKMGALKQTITNEPGEIITDHLGIQSGDGIKYMQPPNFSSTPINIAEKIMDMTRQVTGTTEVTSGEVIGANMAASAIIALQNQAKKPNENYQNKLFRSVKNIGRIWEEFYKTYYNLPRPVKRTDKQGNQVSGVFVGTDHANMGFSLNIDVGPASVFSESVQVSILDRLHEMQQLDKYQYVKYLPSNVVPSELKNDFEREERMIKEMQQMQQMQAEQMQAQMQAEQMQAQMQAQQMQGNTMQQMQAQPIQNYGYGQG